MSVLILGANMKTTEAISHYGSRAKLAAALGIRDVSSISHWGDVVPDLRQFQLEVVTKGVLKATRAKPTTEQPPTEQAAA
jgi:transcriptional repressor of cell division inhibition gene dicB